MRISLDLHVHTVDSKDAYTRREWIAKIIHAKGLDGVAITEHDAFFPKPIEGIVVIPGIEVSSLDGHVIGLGVTETIRQDLTADETIDQIHAQGGVAIIPHPHDPVSPRVVLGRLRSRPDAVETLNSDALLFGYNRWMSERKASSMGLPMVGGSDSHVPATIGDGYTLIDSDALRIDSILAAIRIGRVVPMGRASRFTDKISKYSQWLWRRRMKTLQSA